jgi:hypothetical protein
MNVIDNRNELVKCLPRNGRIAEVGVQRGYFARTIFNIARPRELHLIDVWSQLAVPNWTKVTREVHWDNMREVQQQFSEQIAAGSVILHQGLSQRVLDVFPVGYFDWVYLDGDHRYQEVRAELEICHTRVCDGGFIAGHDFVDPRSSPGAASGQYGVIQAVREFCESANWEIVYLTKGTAFDVDGCENPSYALRRRT